VGRSVTGLALVLLLLLCVKGRGVFRAKVELDIQRKTVTGMRRGSGIRRERLGALWFGIQMGWRGG